MQGSKNTCPMRRRWLTDFDANKKWQISTNICLFIGKSCNWISEERKTHNGQKWCHRRVEWFASGLTCLSLWGPRRLQTKSWHGLCQEKTDHVLHTKPGNGSFIGLWKETVTAPVLIANWRGRQLFCQNAKDMQVPVVQVLWLNGRVKNYHCVIINLSSESANNTVLINAIMGGWVSSYLLNTPLRHLDNYFRAVLRNAFLINSLTGKPVTVFCTYCKHAFWFWLLCVLFLGRQNPFCTSACAISCWVFVLYFHTDSTVKLSVFIFVPTTFKGSLAEFGLQNSREMMSSYRRRGTWSAVTGF